jgi:hypothetical protein
MKSKLLVCFVMCLAVLSIASARGLNSRSPIDYNAIHQKAFNLIHAVPANVDTIAIPQGTDGLMEATINGDTTTSGATGRLNPMRVYKLDAGGFYNQLASINIVNPTGVLTIVGAPGIKATILPQTVNGVQCGMNLVEGSIKLRNLYWESQLSDGSYNNNNFVGTSDGVHASLWMSIIAYLNLSVSIHSHATVIRPVQSSDLRTPISAIFSVRPNGGVAERSIARNGLIQFGWKT